MNCSLIKSGANYLLANEVISHYVWKRTFLLCIKLKKFRQNGVVTGNWDKPVVKWGSGGQVGNVPLKNFLWLPRVFRW